MPQERDTVDDSGQVISEPVAVLQTRTKSLRSWVILEVLVQWLGSSPEDATWESLHQLQLSFLTLWARCFEWEW